MPFEVAEDREVLILVCVSVYDTLAAEPYALVILAHAEERCFFIRRLRLELHEPVFTSLPVHHPIVGKDPETSVLVLLYLINETVAEQGIFIMLDPVAIERIKSFRCSQPHVAVLFLIYAVYCGSQSFAG